MDRQQIATKLAMDALGINVSMGCFADRLVLQKATYLAQAAGVQLGYSYNWYLRGPYSPVLARDGFSIEAELKAGEDESKAWRLDPVSLDRLGKVARLIRSGRTEDRQRRLELLASVHFLVQRRQCSSNAAVLTQRLRDFGKDYSEPEVAEALQELTNEGLLE